MTEGYKLTGSISESEAFTDAAAAELKVLLAIIELDGGDIVCTTSNCCSEEHHEYRVSID